MRSSNEGRFFYPEFDCNCDCECDISADWITIRTGEKPWISPPLFWPASRWFYAAWKSGVSAPVFQYLGSPRTLQPLPVLGKGRAHPALPREYGCAENMEIQTGPNVSLGKSSIFYWRRNLFSISTHPDDYRESFCLVWRRPGWFDKRNFFAENKLLLALREFCMSFERCSGRYPHSFQESGG